jgi:hypothetical protein
MLVRCIAFRYLVIMTGLSVILKLRKRSVHAVAERMLTVLSVILWIGEIFLINLWYRMGNNKNIFLMKEWGGGWIIRNLSYYSMFHSNELTKYTLLQLSYEECSQVTDYFPSRMLKRDASAELRKIDYLLRHFCLSVHPSAWKNWAPTGRIFMKCDIWVFFENLSRKFNHH